MFHPAVAAWFVFLALFLVIDYAADLGLIRGGTFSEWARVNTAYTAPVFVVCVVVLAWHFWGPERFSFNRLFGRRRGKPRS